MADFNETEFLNEYVSDMKTRLDRLKRSIESSRNCLCRCNWIVRLRTIYITPEFDNENKTTGKIKIQDPDQVMRFEEVDAKTMAAVAHNGHGDAGEIVFWKDATKELIAELEEMVAMMVKSPLYKKVIVDGKEI